MFLISSNKKFRLIKKKKMETVSNINVYFVLPQKYKKFEDCSEEMRDAFNVFIYIYYLFRKLYFPNLK